MDVLVKKRAKNEDDIQSYFTRKIKEASRAIPETFYDRFKCRLVEISNAYSDRNLVLFQLSIATGYRIQDLHDLSIFDLYTFIKEGKIVIQEKKQLNAWKTALKKKPNSKRKKPKPREHEIVPELSAILKKYISGKKKSEYAFASQKTDAQGKQMPISREAYSDIIARVGKELGLKQMSGHSLRKTYATRLWEETHNLEYVRIALGHASIEVTRRYLGLDEEIKIEAAKIASKKL